MNVSEGKTKVKEYPIDYTHTTEISMPKHAQILCVKFNPTNEKPFIYALVDPDEPIERRSFIIRESNVYVAPDKEMIRYVGSYVGSDDFRVWHVFEI